MSLRDRLPMLNSDRRSIRYLGYITYSLLALILLGAIIGPAPQEDASNRDASDNTDTAKQECLDDATLETAAETVLMQTGDFKTVDVFIDEYDKVIRVELEPSALAYEAPNDFWLYIYSTVRAMRAQSPCLDDRMNSVEVTTTLPDYKVVTTYPYKSVITRTESSDRTSSIMQR